MELNESLTGAPFFTPKSKNRRHFSLKHHMFFLQDASLLFKIHTNAHTVLIEMHLNCDIAKCRLVLSPGTEGGLLGE